MRLTVFTDYALRVLMYLALESDRRVRIRDIAEAYEISHNHLMKVVNKLARAGLVESSRGVSGGLTLARSPDELTVGEVVRQCEEDVALVECFREDNACVITPDCVLRQVFSDARSAFMLVLDQHTIADLVGPERRLRRRLQLAPRAG